jgi:hypothetical protein
MKVNLLNPVRASNKLTYRPSKGSNKWSSSQAYRVQPSPA